MADRPLTSSAFIVVMASASISVAKIDYHVAVCYIWYTRCHFMVMMVIMIMITISSAVVVTVAVEQECSGDRNSKSCETICNTSHQSESLSC